MRFGITPLTIDLIMEQVFQKKGLDGFRDFHYTDIIRKVAEAGYQHCEIQWIFFKFFHSRWQAKI
ncbi:MAG: hypothetical protein ACTSYC_10710 [Promethearchaeota archaeon]